MIIKGLILTPERRAWLERTTLDRFEEICNDMGIDGAGMVRDDSWMAKRKTNQDTYDGDLDWRAEEGSVFEKSNFTKGTNKRYVRNLSSRIQESLMGTTPFFGALKMPMGRHSEETVKHLENFLQNEVAHSNAQEKLNSAIKTALIVNEAAVKIAHRIQLSYYHGPAEVMVDAHGQPYTTTLGEHVYRGDDVFPDPAVQGLFRLRKDPTVEFPDGQRFQYFPDLKQVEITYNNVDLRVKDYRSFICPLDVECIHEADLIAEIRDIAHQDLAATYGMADPFVAYQRTWGPTSGERQAKTSHGEDEWKNESVEHTMGSYAEIYRRVDADEDGHPEELFMVFDIENRRMVFEDYLHNHMGMRPFEIITGIERVENRWYGVGVMEMMRDHGLYIDAQFNRINVRDSRSDSIRFRKRGAVRQWKDGAVPVFGTDDVFEVEQGQGSQDDPPIFNVNLTEPSEQGVTLMLDMEKSSDLMFGVISAAESSASGLNESKTATGVLNRDRAGDRLANQTEKDMMRQIHRVLYQIVEATLENMSPIVALYGPEGEFLSTINRQEARGMERDVRLLLTKTRSTELLAVQTQAIQIIEAYWHALETNPVKAFYIREHYIEQLKALEVQEADKKLPAITMEEAQARAADIAEAQKRANDPPPKEFMQYEHAPATIQRQMELAAGYKPAPDSEREKPDNGRTST